MPSINREICKFQNSVQISKIPVTDDVVDCNRQELFVLKTSLLLEKEEMENVGATDCPDLEPPTVIDFNTDFQLQ